MMNDKRKINRSDLRKLLDEKMILFMKYISLTDSLKIMLENKDTDNIETLLRKRLSLMCRIDQLDAHIKKLQESDPEGREERQVSFRNLHEVMKKAERLNKDCSTAAKKGLESIQSDLNHIGEIRQGFKNYNGRSSKPPRFIDVKM